LQSDLQTSNFTIYEKADRIGGTWFHNRYPQAACDVQSHLYSVSFEPKLDWSETYAPAKEICEHLEGVARKHNVLPFIQCGVEMIGAEWQAESQTWKVALKRLDDAKDGRPSLKKEKVEHAGIVFYEECNFLLLCGGGLHFPNVPQFKGMEKFKGQILHTASYPEHQDLAGKRVAVVGTGASGIQLVQGIGDVVEQLVVYQRTPGWILPKNQYKYSLIHQSLLKLPLVALAYRAIIYSYAELITFRLMYQGSPLNRRVEKMLVDWYKEQVRDPVLRAKITPNYKVGCKRLLPATTYLQVLQQPNVTLETDPIQEFGEHGLITTSADGSQNEIPVDVVILATGFDINGFGPMVPIRGSKLTLQQTWTELGGAEAYLNVTQFGFPNLFLTLGPNSGTGHMSAINTIECQVTYILDLMRQCREEGVRSVDVNPGIQQQWSDFQQAELDKFVWHSQPGCNSWYRGGKNSGKSTVLMPMSATRYWWRLKSANLSDYHVHLDISCAPSSFGRAMTVLKRWFKLVARTGSLVIGGWAGAYVVRQIFQRMSSTGVIFKMLSWFKMPLILYVGLWWSLETVKVLDRLL